MNPEAHTTEIPLLNRQHYEPTGIRTEEDDELSYYNALEAIQRKTRMSTQKFYEIYTDTMRFFSDQERLSFTRYQSGDLSREQFYKECANYLRRAFPNEMNFKHDFDIMMSRIDLAMFHYDVIQPLIDEPETTDIKICGPTDIRVRVKGKAYKSNAMFFDENDLMRFINGLFIRNHVQMGRGIITFTDAHDDNYILRFTVSEDFINCPDYAYIHIRKVPKQKLYFPDLISAGMLNEDIVAYLKDKAKVSKGVVFAGPPGSGKSTILNAFIEFIPKWRETLVIQENDELFTEQSGFMFKHTTHGFHGEPIVTLEDLGKMALVEGCNEFIIGEVKGGEMRYAMTLVNAGGYAALTVHSQNAYETMDKLADLVKYGSSYSFDEAKSMLKTFDTVVYLEGFKVREILEVHGYDLDRHVFNYECIYKYGAGSPPPRTILHAPNV